MALSSVAQHAHQLSRSYNCVEQARRSGQYCLADVKQSRSNSQLASASQWLEHCQSVPELSMCTDSQESR